MLSTKQVKVIHPDRNQVYYINKWEMNHYMSQGFMVYTNEIKKCNPDTVGRHIKLPSFRLRRAYTNGATCFTTLVLIAIFFIRPLEALYDLFSKMLGFAGIEDRNFFLQIGDVAVDGFRQLSWIAIGIFFLMPLLWAAGYGVVLFITR